MTQYRFNVFFRAENQCFEHCLQEIDNHQKHYFMELVSDCWLFIRLQCVTGGFLAFLALGLVFYRHSVSAHMAGLCLTSATLIMTDVFLFTRYAAALEKSMVSVERLQQYENIPQVGWFIFEKMKYVIQ